MTTYSLLTFHCMRHTSVIGTCLNTFFALFLQQDELEVGPLRPDIIRREKAEAQHRDATKRTSPHSRQRHNRDVTSSSPCHQQTQLIRSQDTDICISCVGATVTSSHRFDSRFIVIGYQLNYNIVIHVSIESVHETVAKVTSNLLFFRIICEEFNTNCQLQFARRSLSRCLMRPVHVTKVTRIVTPLKQC